MTVLLDLLLDVVRTDPQRPFLITPDRTRAYAEVAEEAQDLARGLRAAGHVRVGIAVGDPATAIVLLIAASAAGVEPCVYPQGDATARGELAAQLGHEVVVVDDAPLSDIGALPVGALRGGAADLPDAPDDAVMILTSGTTGRPKGTRHRWSRLLTVVQAGEGAQQRWLLAYNMNQFAGLQVVLQALASGAAIVVPASVQPRHAVEAMRVHGVTHASATPTFWRFAAHLLQEPGAVRPALQQVTLGGEAIPEPVLAAIVALFPDARISQIYASSEFGSSVSVRDGRPGLPLSVLDRSDDAPVQLRIVDGELQARSSVGMVGYHGDADRDAGWHPTGDLVEIVDDRIRFVGRTSDVINVGGVKVAPLPIEEVVSAVPGVVAAVVYGRPNAVTGNVVATEVVAAEGVDADDLKARIRAAVTALPDAHRPRSIRIVDALDVRNQKLRRPTEPS
ncbi:MAG TPA: class I adenylate-forming enzyme family protein [Mycobacteriales bacterium]|nr:class I adenylate-forming enzyme family protein [Mycobacteriales bacterium]